jgi:hypothetical protein
MQQKEVWTWVGGVVLYFALLVGLGFLYHEVQIGGRLAARQAGFNTFYQFAFADMTQAMEAYKADYGRYPPEEIWVEELHAGVVDVELEVNTNRTQYITMAAVVDPWGNPYQAIFPANLQESVRFYSMGADGITLSEGDDLDDFNSWNSSPLPVVAANGGQILVATPEQASLTNSVTYTNGVPTILATPPAPQIPVVGNDRFLQWLFIFLTPIALFWPVLVLHKRSRRKREAILAQLEAERLSRVYPSDS